MNYKETINYLFNMLPVYQNQGKVAIKKDLTNIVKLSQALGDPHKEYKTIHIGGTNGKGTVSHMLASVLQESGLKVGLYTSPHYIDFRERIKINGDYISEEQVVSFVEKMKDLISEIRPSFFEMTVAMAFEHFRSEGVDYAVIEVGLGGRLDSTNIISPEISVITNIGLDHMDMLGHSISLIALEKAGIIKTNIPVIIGEHDKQSAPVFLKKALNSNSSINFASEEWSAENSSEKTIIRNKDMHQFVFSDRSRGPFFLKNVSTVLSTVTHNTLNINEKHITHGINVFIQNTNYKGRWQWLSRDKNILLDSGHNEHALSKTLNHLNHLNYPKIHFVLGFVKDKDVEKLIKLLPSDGQYYFAKPSIFRGAKVSSYQQSIVTRGLQFNSYLSVSSALEAAKRSRDKADLIFVGGSSFVVGEILEKIKR